MKGWEKLAGRAEDWLTDLGDCPRSVAQALSEMGVRGVRKRLSPLAHYVSLMVGRTCLVEGMALHMFGRKGRIAVSVLLPAAAFSFQVAFDAGDYPALEVRTVRPGDSYLQTPWGVATATLPCFPGVLWVRGDCGMGLMVRKAWAGRHLSAAARKLAIDLGDWLAFSYEGPWAVVPWEFPEGRQVILKVVGHPIMQTDPHRGLRLILNGPCRAYLIEECPEAVFQEGTVVAIHDKGDGRVVVQEAGGKMHVASKSSYLVALNTLDREVMVGDLEILPDDAVCRGR